MTNSTIIRLTLLLLGIMLIFLSGRLMFFLLIHIWAFSFTALVFFSVALAGLAGGVILLYFAKSKITVP